jgi:hypothetical protein
MLCLLRVWDCTRAQKLFRQRSKQRQKENADTIQALANRVKKLEVEKAAVEARNLILEQIVRLNVPNAIQQSLAVKVRPLLPRLHAGMPLLDFAVGAGT